MCYILLLRQVTNLHLIIAILSWSKVMDGVTSIHSIIKNVTAHFNSVLMSNSYATIKWQDGGTAGELYQYSTVLTMFFLFSRVCVERFFSSRVAAATNRKQHCRDVIWPYFVIDHREYCIHHAFKSSTIVPPSSTTSHRDLCSF